MATAADRDEHVGAVRGLRPGVRGLARGRRGLFPTPAHPGPAVLRCGCWPRSRLSTGRPGGCWPAPADDSLTLGEFLRRPALTRRYFTGHFMIPLVAAVWSCSPAEALGYPARYLFQFLDHHGMLSVRRVAGLADGRRRLPRPTSTGSPSGLTERPQPAPRCGPVGAGADGVEVRRRQRRHRAVTTRVVIATHPDQALRLLADPTPAEREVLGAFRYSRQRGRCCTPTPRCCRAPGGPGRPGTTCCRDCAGAADAGARQLRPEPAAAAGRPDRLPGHAQRPGPGRPGAGHRPDELRAPALHAPARSPRSGGCRS